MKKTLLFAVIFIILIIVSYSFFEVIYTSKPVAVGATWVKSMQKLLAHKPEKAKPRDIKIPDELPMLDFLNNSDSELNHSTKVSPLVVIDPGHGGIDPGAPSKHPLEKDINLDVCLRLNAILKSSGVNTYMTRTYDVFIGPKERILTANAKKATLFISIHMNWLESNVYNGTTTLYYPSDTLRIGNLTEKNYAKIIQDELMKVIETKNMGINHRDDLAVLRHATMPSVLVELGFLSNRKDVALLSSESFRQKAAEGLANGIKKALSEVK